ncbi:MAG: hypothetical protein JWP64_1122 [Pseudonocardia sp.]|uniref:hypothetical protein n=1 Tax=Pseudonocardia sp. TaxID=60912 RepID=UPI0026301666|nr:hypothetical protein [Pseudonocardia sp.]MCU1626173.1 hypothetical protein [Pseudonocardia sp.]
MTAKITAFLKFWYDFIVGDDWRIAVAVIAALALTEVVSSTSLPAWWILPAAVALLLPLSLRRAHRRRRPSGLGGPGSR